jgi:hypothetical protein
MTDYVGIGALVTAACTGVAILIAAIRGQRKGEKDEVDADPVVNELPPVPKTLDPEGVLTFLAEVRADNVDLRRRDGEKDRKIAALERTLHDMSEEAKISHKVQEAFSRWVVALFGAWGRTATPPLPEGDDLILLRDFVPRG